MTFNIFSWHHLGYTLYIQQFSTVLNTYRTFIEESIAKIYLHISTSSSLHMHTYVYKSIYACFMHMHFMLICARMCVCVTLLVWPNFDIYRLFFFNHFQADLKFCTAQYVCVCVLHPQILEYVMWKWILYIIMSVNQNTQFYYKDTSMYLTCTHTRFLFAWIVIINLDKLSFFFCARKWLSI